MARPATRIVFTQEERKQLEAMAKKPRAQNRYAERARIILSAAQGCSNKEIARALNTREARISKWRVRFEREGLSGLHDDFRPGRPVEVMENFRELLLARLDEEPPEGFARWNGKLLARSLGQSADRVWRELRLLGISLQRRRSWCVSTDAQFSQKAADVIGLYLSPPADNAVVLSVDEKPCIQALERAQGWLRMADGRSLTGFIHEYKRHGTTTLFAALNIATGQIHAGHYKRKRRIEFLDFMDQLVGAPSRQGTPCCARQLKQPSGGKGKMGQATPPGSFPLHSHPCFMA
jgi:transposase